MQDFRALRVWCVAHRLTLATYRITRSFPREEQYGLVSQLRRSASSIGANIAEGCGRASAADTRRCCHQALGSACEVLNHVILARDLELLDPHSFAAMAADADLTRRMLIRLIQRLDARVERA